MTTLDQKPDDIPQDVWERAKEALTQASVKGSQLGEPVDPLECISLAIMADRLNAISAGGEAEVPAGWKLVPEDLLTHLGDWQTACQIARQHSAPATADSDDASYWDHQLRTIANIRAMLAAAPASPSVDAHGVKVKRLEWGEISVDRGDGGRDLTGEIAAETVLGTYSVTIDTDEDVAEYPWCVWTPLDSLGHFATIDEGRLAAQADYEQRILSALAKPSP